VFRALRVSRTRVIAGVAAFLVVGAFTGVALAGGPYTVAVKVVPKTVPLPGTFTVTASGMSANTSRLLVFINEDHKCALTAKVDASFAGDVLTFRGRVTGSYSRSQAETDHIAGQHRACAYLTSLPPSPHPRARAGFVYTVG
jgi:hypothetical protein